MTLRGRLEIDDKIHLSRNGGLENHRFISFIPTARRFRGQIQVSNRSSEFRVVCSTTVAALLALR